jgi:acyl carrier protein
VTDIRDVAIRALDRATGFLSDPELARLALSGQDIDLARLELDSLGRFEAMMEIEEKLGIEIDDDEIGEIDCLNGLVAFLQARVE